MNADTKGARTASPRPQQLVQPRRQRRHVGHRRAKPRPRSAPRSPRRSSRRTIAGNHQRQLQSVSVGTRGAARRALPPASAPNRRRSIRSGADIEVILVTGRDRDRRPEDLRDRRRSSGLTTAVASFRELRGRAEMPAPFCVLSEPRTPSPTLVNEVISTGSARLFTNWMRYLGGFRHA